MCEASDNKETSSSKNWEGIVLGLQFIYLFTEWQHLEVPMGAKIPKNLVRQCDSF